MKENKTSSTNLLSDQLDDLLTGIYHPITRAWLKKNPNLEKLNSKDLKAIASFEDISKNSTSWFKGSAPFSSFAGVNDHSNLNAVYIRIWESSIQDSAAMLKKVFQMLSDDGIFVAEVISFSEFKAYPYHYAFTRATELIGGVEKNEKDSDALAEKLEVLGFNIIEKVYSGPAFLNKAYNRIISTCLQAFQKEIIHKNNSSSEEISALLPTLRRFEEQQDTLVSRPGVHLFMAEKNLNSTPISIK